VSTQCLFWALKLKVGNPHRKLILLTLADIANEQRQCWPSHDYIAERAECSRRSVIDHLGALERDGLITVSRRYDARQQQCNVYTIVAGGVQDLHSGGVQELHKGGAGAAHNTPIDTPIYINKDAWAEWIDYRKQSKKKMTPATIAKQQKFLSEYDDDTQQRIIDTSIKQGWAGLFEPKENNHANTQGHSGQPANKGRRTTADEVREARERARNRHNAGQPDLGGVVATQ